jgi:hypothetical protein
MGKHNFLELSGTVVKECGLARKDFLIFVPIVPMMYLTVS